MFNSVSREEFDTLQKQCDDVVRALNFEQRERQMDADRLRNVITLEQIQKREADIKAKLEAEAKAEAAVAKAANAEAYAQKSVEMAAKCASDFATAAGTMTEKFLGAMKEFKPAAAGEVKVLPVAGGVEINTSGNCKC